MSKHILMRAILLLSVLTIIVSCQPPQGSTAVMTPILYEESMDVFPNPEHGFHHARELPRPKDFDIRDENITFHIRGNYSLIHDQLALSKGEATQEEILLNQQELETQYSYRGSMGISYTFGSIFNNIVNPRF